MKNNIKYFMSAYKFKAIYQSPWSMCPWGGNERMDLMAKERKI